MTDSFVHLHVHTEYSMLDGAARVKELFAEAARMGMPALAVTDHGNLYGAYDFYQQGRAAGVKPILGIEAYLAPGSRYDKTKVAKEYSHLTLLASNERGWANLVQLASRASLEGYYYKPRMDRELLAQYSEGLIATSGCLASEVNQLLLRDDVAGARTTMGEYADIFGRGNFYVEVMRHGIADQDKTHPMLVQLAQEVGLPLVATNDLHYTHQKDSVAHEVLLCVQTGATLADPNRFRFEADEFYLKSPAQMRDLWRDLPAACDSTLEIAERCEFHFEDGKNLLPTFPIPEGYTEESWFRAEVERGMHWRYGANPSERVRAQVQYELGVIVQMGFPAYFLVVADLIRYANENGIRVGPGRGSAAGCTVSYCLGITGLDPLKYGLIFERFLNPERVSMPDIDMDFDERRRGDMIRYATERYGEDRVAQIITFGTIKAKQAIRDSARVLGMPYNVGDRLSKLMPAPVMGRDYSLSDCFERNPEKPEGYAQAAELRKACEESEDDRRVLETARGLEGLKRQAGVHAAGVVICRDPLTDHIPVWRREADGAIITQFDMNTVEKLGLLKMDFLGLRNLTVLEDCLAHIRANLGETVVLEDVPLDDQPTYDLLCRGESIGVFQLEGGPMRSLMRSLQPNCFDDVSALIALYRPGPMGAGMHIDFVERKHGRRKVTYEHPDLEEVLGETYGVVVYQEQVMTVAQKMAGYTLGEADELRRAMGKKKREVLAKEKEKFCEGFVTQGYERKLGEKMFSILEPFADYAFNKAHSAGYGLLSYWTAYLKAHYPSEFMAALLTSVKDNRDQSALYLHECRTMGIKVLPPDVNESDLNFTPRGTDIRFGLSAIRNVGENVVGSIIATRRAKGRYTGFHDFLRKVESSVCNKRVVESLVKAGSFDSLGHTRKGLIQVHAEAIDACLETKRAEAIGQFSLFGDAADAEAAPAGVPEVPIPLEEWDKTTLLGYEREMLSLYVSDHPLFGVEHVLAQHTDTKLSDISAGLTADGAVVTCGGILSSLARKMTKRGEPYAQAVLEDLVGAVDVWFFPTTYAKCSTLLAEDAVVVVKAKVDRREDVAKLVVMDVTRPELAESPRGPVVIRLDAPRCTEPVVDQLKEVLGCHPGRTEVQLHLVSGERTTVLRLDEGLRVAPTASLMADLKQLLGPAAVAG